MRKLFDLPYLSKLKRRAGDQPSPPLTGNDQAPENPPVSDALQTGYQIKLDQEKIHFKDYVDISALPPIQGYWAHERIRPKEELFGFSSPNEMFRKYLQQQCDRWPTRVTRILSIGSGNCDVEIGLAQELRAKGNSRFVIECLDLNPAMLERGRTAAFNTGIADHLGFVEGDFNQWRPDREYDVVMANQVLHHVVNLEGLFEQIKSALSSDGQFVISDAIGRNGHMRWPEALEIVHEYWQRLPPAYRYNRQLQRHEELYENWDCSAYGFEGIRAQDILPLLVDRFHFQLFIAFGNVIDPFVDRAFGPNFDVTAQWDRDFIDEVHDRDEMEMVRGHLKPTHMLAVVGNDRSKKTMFTEPLSPLFCVRQP